MDDSIGPHIEFVTFFLYNQDLIEPRAAMVGFEKAFNRQNHARLFTKLGDWAWLLRIVIGFLTERELIVAYKGEASDPKAMPGGDPEGLFLELFYSMCL